MVPNFHKARDAGMGTWVPQGLCLPVMAFRTAQGSGQLPVTWIRLDILTAEET